MKTIKKNLIALCLILLIGLTMPFNVIGADNNVTTNALTLSITSTAQLAIVTAPTIAMALGGATQAGAPVSATSTNSLSRLRISSLVDNTTRTITAILSSSIAASNTQLTVQLGTPNSDFVNNANMGTLNAAQDLSSGAAVTLATGIGTCWSGILTDDGYPITYTFSRVDGKTSYTSPGALTVTYTLSE